MHAAVWSFVHFTYIAKVGSQTGLAGMHAMFACTDKLDLESDLRCMGKNTTTEAIAFRRSARAIMAALADMNDILISHASNSKCAHGYRE